MTSRARIFAICCSAAVVLTACGGGGGGSPVGAGAVAQAPPPPVPTPSPPLGGFGPGIVPGPPLPANPASFSSFAQASLAAPLALDGIGWSTRISGYFTPAPD